MPTNYTTVELPNGRTIRTRTRTVGTRFVIDGDCDGGYIVFANGYQWGTDPAAIDHSIGCYRTTYATIQDALTAIPDMRGF